MASPPRMYSPDLQPLLQSLLATLTDIDFAYEREREVLSTDLPEGRAKVRVLRMLEERHRAQRQPYLHQLATVHEHFLHPSQ
jgi:hypothetical protein